MATDPFPRNIHAGMKKSAETTKRKLVADIARFGSEAYDRTQRQTDTLDALTEASEPLDEAASMNQGVLAELSGQRDLVLGNYERDTVAAQGRHERSNDRRAKAHADYLDKLKSAVPYHRRELKAFEEAAAAGRARAGGGGGGRGASPRKTKVVTQEIPSRMEQQGFSVPYIERLGQMVGQSPELFSAIDEEYATLVEDGKSMVEINSEIRRLLGEAGLGNVQITDYLNMFNAKYAGSFGLDGQMGPLLDLGGAGMERHGPGGNTMNQRQPGNAIQDYMGQFGGSQPQSGARTSVYGEEYFDDGTVFYDGKVYTLQEWDAAMALMERSRGGFGLF